MELRRSKGSNLTNAPKSSSSPVPSTPNKETSSRSSSPSRVEKSSLLSGIQSTETEGHTSRSDPLDRATTTDKQQWRGFCEIESEPAFFNVMLKDFGVRGVKVQEVVSLDDEMLSILPRPVYGLIFLFRWLPEDSERQEQSCPDEVWFANQTANFSCASVALLNIVNNVPDIDLGENLSAFKDFTQKFTPALRGYAISNFEFVKGIHNSFARKMDMLNTDLLLKNEFKNRKRKRKANDDDDESGFHFVAFMPIQGDIWKLDGLERQPMRLDQVDNDWLDQVKPDIMARMAQYEENQIEFVILSLVKDPLCSATSALATNVKELRVIQERTGKAWSNPAHANANGSDVQTSDHLDGPDPGLSLTQDDIEKAGISQSLANIILEGSSDELIAYGVHLVDAQPGLRLAIQEELQAKVEEEDKANARRRDTGGLMQKFARKVKSKAMATE